MRAFVTVVVAISMSAAAQEPWQRIQMPTASQVAQTWTTPPPEYGPEPYYGLNGAVTAPTNPPAFHLNNVTDLRILISRAAPDTQLATANDKIL